MLICSNIVLGKQKRQKAYIEEGGETFDFLREDIIRDASKKRPGTYTTSKTRLHVYATADCSFHAHILHRRPRI